MNISKIMLATIAVAGLSTVVVTSAKAQAPIAPTDKVQKPIRIKLGAFFPTDSSVKDAVGSTFFAYGASYDFGKTKADNPIVFSGYIDGASQSKTKNGVKGEVSYIGVGPALRTYLSSALAPTKFYAGVGLGAYFLHSKASANGVSASSNETKVGGKLFAGVELNQGFFGEVDYTAISKIDDVKPSGVNLGVGYRF